jgi:putative hemolysin
MNPMITPLLLQTTAVDEGGLSLPLSTFLLVVSVLGYALVNSIEIAVVGVNRIRLRHLSEEGNKSAQALQRLRSREDLFFGAIVLLQNIFVFLASAMASLIGVESAGGWGLVVAAVLTPAAVALFGEITPKVLAARASDSVALIVARPVELLTLALRPVAIVFAAAPNVLSRLLFGQSATVTPTVTEAELRMLIDIGAEEGAVGEEEAELMDRVFRFHDRLVNEVMIPRTEVAWLESGTTLSDFYTAFAEKPHSRFPVYADTIDNVIGVVTIKDVLRAVAQGEAEPSTRVDALMRPAFFVPETKPVGALVWQMQEERHQLAVAVDEFGGTAGIVTLELLLEEMVGRVVDELGQPTREFQTIDERTVRVDGGMSVAEAREELSLDIPDGDYETVAGYVLSELGHIPKAGETLEGRGYRMSVTEMKGVKIEEVIVTRVTVGEQQPTEAASS